MPGSVWQPRFCFSDPMLFPRNTILFISKYNWGTRGQSIGENSVRNPGAGGYLLSCWRPPYRENGPVECRMRWALTGRFKHSNRELLALYICPDMVVFVVRKGSHRGPRESSGVPGASLERLRDVAQGSHERAWASQGRALGSQGRAMACPGVPGAYP